MGSILVPSTVHESTSLLQRTRGPFQGDPSSKRRFDEAIMSSAISTSLTEKQDESPIKIAHVISLITCTKASRVKGFLDALVILRHSIHQNSVHNSAGKYSYQMYAIIHPDGGCVQHVSLLKRLGYIPLVKETPVDITTISTDNWYRQHVESENCCGSKE